MFERSVFIPGGLNKEGTAKGSKPVLVERVDVEFEGYMPSYPHLPKIGRASCRERV